MFASMYVKEAVVGLLDRVISHDIVIITIFSHVFNDAQETESLLKVIREGRRDVAD